MKPEWSIPYYNGYGACYFTFSVMVREQRGQKESLLTVFEMMRYIIATPAPHVYSAPCCCTHFLLHDNKVLDTTVYEDNYIANCSILTSL